MADSTAGTPEERASARVKEFTDLMWHVATYVIINAFLWGIDLYQGGGVNWAFWVTIAWGVGLGFHVASYLLDDSGLQNRRYQRYLEEERARDAADHSDV